MHRIVVRCFTCHFARCAEPLSAIVKESLVKERDQGVTCETFKVLVQEGQVRLREHSLRNTAIDILF